MIKNDGIKVSTLCITYNQENFISQELESFIKQKTNYNFDILKKTNREYVSMCAGDDFFTNENKV